MDRFYSAGFSEILAQVAGPLKVCSAKLRSNEGQCGADVAALLLSVVPAAMAGVRAAHFLHSLGSLFQVIVLLPSDGVIDIGNLLLEPLRLQRLASSNNVAAAASSTPSTRLALVHPSRSVNGAPRR